MARVFIVNGKQIPDPDLKKTVEQVRRDLAETFFPDLANADVREEPRGEDTFYHFTRRVGTKGRRRAGRDGDRSGGRTALVNRLRTVPEKEFAILQLAAELYDAEGELDVDAAAERGPEITLALAEAQASARAVQAMTAALGRLPAR